MAQGLTVQQNRLLGYLQGSDVTPSYREMASALGLSSISQVSRLLHGLQDRGFIEGVGGTRGVRVLKRDVDLSSVPLEALLAEIGRRHALDTNRSAA